MVESLVPIFVWVLEGLAGCKAQLRDREEEAEREKAEREELLDRYQAEKALRKESQEVGTDGRFESFNVNDNYNFFFYKL